MPAPQTIQIFLPQGRPEGIRIADITSRTVQVSLVPRADIAAAKARKEFQQVGIYLLISAEEEGQKPVVYVGEAEPCYERLTTHNAKKDFWDKALVITSKTGALTKAHAKYLEWLCYQKLLEAKRVKLENKNIPSKSTLPEYAEAEVLESFEIISILTATLGYPFFKPIGDNVNALNTLTIKAKGVMGKGVYSDEGLIVLAGSTLSKQTTKGMAGLAARARESLLSDGGIVDKGSHMELTENYSFNSPSTAASFVQGNAVNGWLAWKDETGQTLDQLIRQEN